MIAILILLIFVGSYYLTREQVPEIKDGSYLVLDMVGMFPEDAARDFWTQLIEGKPLTVFDLVENIRKARHDDRIEGILLRFSLMSMGYGKAQEIRGALEEFKESGKRVISYIEIARDLEYYIACVADEIYMTPVSVLMVDGIVANALFLRGTFDMLGIRPNFLRVGDYKTAVDLFQDSEMSDEYRWELNSLLDSIYSRYVSDVAESRGMTEEDLRDIIDRGMLDSRQSLEAGLVDDLLYINQLEGKLKGGYDEFRGVDADVYRNIDPSSIGIAEDARFALIIAEGSLNMGGSGESADFGKIAGSSTLVDAIHRALEEEEIEAILLRVNSPGGVWVASDVIWGELVKAMESKPVVVSMSDVAASGGYYIAMPADAIVAEPSTITGSIGLYVGKFNVSGLYSKIGVNRETVSRGKDAELFSELRDFSEEERDRVYRRIWDFYWNDFVMKAHEGRDLSPEFIDSVGRGRVWTGEQALELGLVDELGGIWTAVERAKEIAGIAPEKNVSLVLLPEPKELLELLLEGDLVMKRPSVEIHPGMEEMISALQWMNRMGSGEILAMMPYRIEFE